MSRYVSIRCGSFTLAGAVFCLATTSDAQQADNVPWEATPTPTIVQQPMRFSNGDVKLVGTLYLPPHGGRVPAVVVFWGAQAPTREFALYQQLATGLPVIGVAVLVFDRRGSGESGGSNAHSTFQDLASDGIAALMRSNRIRGLIPRRSAFGASARVAGLLCSRPARRPKRPLRFPAPLRSSLLPCR